jgi:hypothetical protein
VATIAKTRYRMTRQWYRSRHGRVEFSPKTEPYPPVMTFPFPLRGGAMVRLILPLDLTTREAERLCRYIMSMAFSDEEVTRSTKHDS